MAVLKGMHIKDLYDAESGQRELADADLFVPTEDLWVLLSQLIRRGYSVSKLRFGRYKIFKGNPKYPSACGICPTSSERDDRPVEFDIHFGGFPACGEGLITISEDDLIQHGDVRFLRIEKAIAVSLAHIARQGYCRLRDVNDLFLLLRQPGLDLDSLTKEIQSAYLGSLFKAMLRIIAACYPEQPFYVPELRPNGKLKFIDKLLLFERRKEARGFADDVKFYGSRSWQIDYLTRMYVRELGVVEGVARTLRNSVYLFQTGRAHETWTSRRIGGIGYAERFVLYPLLHFQDEVGFSDLERYATKHNYSLERVRELELVILNPGSQEELVIAPGLLLAQSNYAGDPDSLPDVSRIVREMCDELRISTYEHLVDL